MSALLTLTHEGTLSWITRTDTGERIDGPYRMPEIAARQLQNEGPRFEQQIRFQEAEIARQKDAERKAAEEAEKNEED